MYLPRWILTLAATILACCQVFSQKYDYNYLIRSSIIGSGISVSYIDSLQDIHFQPFQWEGTVSGTPVLSDKEGNYLGYFNSRNLYDSLGRVAINGDSMAVGFYQNYLFQYSEEHEGLGNGGNCAFIPINDSLYYLFYSSAELWAGAPGFAIDFSEKNLLLTSYADGLYLTKVRLNPDRTLYILPHEKHILLINKLFQFANLMFCKQHNNDGWWLIIPNALDSLATRVMIEANGEVQQLLDVPFSSNYWRVRTDTGFDFSSDGQYLARIIHRAKSIFEDILEIYSFDRCDGEVRLLEMDSFPIPEYFSHRADVKFSNEGYLLYMAFGSYILQFNLNDLNPLENPDTIGVYDGFEYFGLHPIFDGMWKLPNGRILVSGGEFTPYLHYIENPDELGSNCNFVQRAIQLPPDPLNEGFGITVRNLPSFPPFRMPPLDQPCNTSTDEALDQTIIKVFPNPTFDIFSITCSTIINEVIVFDLNGIEVMKVFLSGYEDHYEFSLENWPAGMYMVVCRDSQGYIVGSKKLVRI